MSTSAYFSLCTRLQHGIVSILGWSELRAVQELTIEAVLEGKNSVVLAPTAGGKTEAAFFPILDRLHEQPSRGVNCVYISPLKALLNNQETRVSKLAGMVGMEAFKWHGDVGAGPRKRFLKAPSSILLTTPESLEGLLMKGQALEHRLFEGLRYIVIDEIHALAANDRGAHLMAVLERLGKHTDADVQRLGLSATVGNAEDLARWMQGSSQRPWTVIDPPRTPSTRRIVVRHVGGDVEETARAAAPVAHGRKSLFFTQGRSYTELARQAFEAEGVQVFVHHSSVSQEFRERAEESFMSTGGSATLINTSTLELGIDVGDLDLVIQLDAPPTVSSFLQRLGRTGRRDGSRQHLEFFTSDAEKALQAVAILNLAIKGFVEKVEPQTANTPVLLHQVLAHILENTAISRKALWRSLQGPYPFRSIERETFDEIVNHLLATDVLREVDHLLVMGEEGEQRFGGRHFLDLYSVFETLPDITVKTLDEQVIGTLQTEFVFKMQKQEFIFLLAGRAWQAVEVNLDRGFLKAKPVEGGKAPKWHGASGFLGREIVEGMRNVLLSDEQPSFLDDEGKEEIRALQREYRGILEHDRCPMTRLGRILRIHTFAGGRINATIAALLEQSQAIVVKGFGDLEVDVAPAGDTELDADLISSMLRAMHDIDRRISGKDMAALVTNKTREKLAKFQQYLPPDLESAYLADRMFDFSGVAVLSSKSSFPLVKR